jgi:ornithine cyclodeaminase/alanine dehydrogenase-like protein (mu-crystallin family)
MAKKRLGIGFIGSGFVAQFHIRSFVAVRDADVLGVYSPNRAHAEHAAAWPARSASAKQRPTIPSRR